MPIKVFRCLSQSAVLMLGLLAPMSASAGLVVSATNPTTAAGASGWFDILLTNTDSSSVDISSFNSALEVASNSGLTFTNVDAGTTPGYIFGSVQNGPLGTISGSSITLADFLDSGSQTVGAGATVGLAHVLYSLAGNTPAGTPIAITFTGAGSQIYDASLSEILPLSLQGGTITVTAAAVPEPGTLVMAGLLSLGGLVAVRRSRARARAQHANETTVA